MKLSNLNAFLRFSSRLSPRPRSHAAALAAAIAGAILVRHTLAASFTVTSGTNDTVAKTLGSGAGQTGVIQQNGSLSISGTTVAITISGSSATVTNLGTLLQSGTGRDIRDNTGVTGLVVYNGTFGNTTALMQTADADVIQMNKSPASVSLFNFGIMTSLNASKGGSQAIDFNAMLSGTNVVTNFSTGQILAQDSDAVRPGVNGVINNSGVIRATHTTDTGDDGIDAQTNSGVMIQNFSTGIIEAARHGITGGNITAPGTYTMTIGNDFGGVIEGNDGSGINIDGINANEFVTVTNGGTITGNGVTGDGDGVDVDGVISLNNTGTIKSLNSFSSTTPGHSEGVTVGGGTITNSGLIEGDVAAGNLNAVGRGITLAGVDTSGAPEAIYSNSSITNSGMIMGQGDSGIAIDGTASGFTVTITNLAAGVIMGGGSTPAIRTGDDNDTINNSGQIMATGTGKAIDLAGGNDALSITGGTASIIGDVSGGTGTNTLTIDPGVSNAFGYAGSFSNFNTAEIKSGQVTFTGVSTYAGTTKISGGRLILNGINRLASGSTLDLAGGTLEVLASGANGQTFASLKLSASSSIDLDSDTSLTFGALDTLTPSATLAIVEFEPQVSPAYAIRFAGDLTGNPTFLSLIQSTSIDGQAPTYFFDGAFTNVTIPEPGSLCMLGFGAATLLRRRRMGPPRR